MHISKPTSESKLLLCFITQKTLCMERASVPNPSPTDLEPYSNGRVKMCSAGREDPHCRGKHNMFPLDKLVSSLA